MDSVLAELDNRDIALLVWLGVALTIIVVYRPTRESLWSILKLLSLSKLTIGLLIVIAYIALVVWAAHSLGIWQWWMLKDTVWWLFGTALVVFFSLNKSSEEEHYFKNVALGGMKFSVILGFILNLYVFSLAIEIFLLPILVLLGMLLAVAGTDKKYEPAKKFFNGTMTLVVLGLIVYVTSRLLADFHDFATLKTLEDFFLPIGLTAAVLPVMYAIAIYAAYESLFVLIHFRLEDGDGLYRFAQWQVFKACRLSLSRVNQFSKNFVHQFGGVRNRSEILAVTSSFKAKDDADRIK